MKIGVTGTRSGMNEKQVISLLSYLAENFVKGSELHHGDCVGVDAQVADLANRLGYKIVCHPPILESLRANYPSDDYRAPYTYFQRNRNIVDETDLLLVVPYQDEHQSHGGTWYTHDYAAKRGKERIVFLPGRSG